MSYDPRKARIARQLIEQGLSEDDAFRQAGISAAEEIFYVINDVPGDPNRGAIEPINPPPVRNQETTVTDTVEGGDVTVYRVTPEVRVETPLSRLLQTEAAAIEAEKQAYAATLRAQGLTAREVNRDPEWQRLNAEQIRTANEAERQRIAQQTGAVLSARSVEGPGGTVFQQTPSTPFLTTQTSGEDPEVNTQQIAQIRAGITENVDPLSPDVSPYGEENEPFDPDLVTLPGDVEFADDYLATDDFANLEAAAAAEAEAFRRGDIPPPVVSDPQVDPLGPAFDDDGNLFPGWTLDGNGNAVYVGPDFIDPSLTASAAASRAAARQQSTLDNARRQATIQSQRKQGNDTDWRVKLSLAPQSNYLYNAPDVAGQPGSGILAPLKATGGVIFPYTPRITTAYVARYNSYDLTHSNYRGYFYQGSHVDDINLEATFTAQDTAEAEYLLAVIHFFRSVTKMFYGQDAQRGTPPPLVYLRGLGDFQFNLHPCVVAQFNYNLPNDVDYIRARSKNTAVGTLLQRRDRKTLPTNIFDSVLARLSAANLSKGAQAAPPPVPSLGSADAVYVPTKLDMQIVLKPIQSREQVSRQFSLRQYANGDLLKGGFW